MSPPDPSLPDGDSTARAHADASGAIPDSDDSSIDDPPGTGSTADFSTGRPRASGLAHPDERTPWWGPVALAVLVGLVVCTNIANVVWADWVNRRPEALLALSSRQRYLALTAAGGISFVPYVLIGFVRLGAAFLACHLAGRAYRLKVLNVFTRFLGLTPEMVQQYELMLAKAEVVIVPLFVGSNIVAALTGVRHTPMRRLLPLLAIGLIGRLLLMWWLAEIFERPLLKVLDFLQRYTLPMIIASFALVIFVNVRNFRRGN